MSDSETREALRRAARRAGFHLLRAGLEGVKAVEALVDELAKLGKEAGEDTDRGPERVRIDIE